MATRFLDLNKNDRYSLCYKNYEFNGNEWIEDEIIIPEHHWKFNEDSNQNYVSDSGSIPKHLTQKGTTSLGNTGKIKYSGYVANNNGDRFETSSTESASISGVTISAWFKCSTSDSRMIYSVYNSSTSNNMYLFLKDNSGTDEIILYFAGESSTYTAGDIHDDEWHHVVGKYYSTGSTGFINIYLDGVIVKTESKSKVTVNQLASTSTTSNGMHFVGNYAYTHNSYPFNGYLEDVRVYHKALSELDIANIYNYSKGTYSQINVSGYPTLKYPTHYWKLTEDGAETLIYASDSGSLPTIMKENNDIDQTGNTPINSYWSYFDTRLDYFSSTGITETYSGFTISFFVKMKTNNNGFTILDLNNNSSNRIHIYIDSTPTLYVDVNSNTTSYNVSTNILYYFTITYDMSNVEIYNNITSVTTNSLSNQSLSLLSSNTYKIGSSPVGIGADEYYLSNIKVYNYSLTIEEIENNYYLYKDQNKTL